MAQDPRVRSSLAVSLATATLVVLGWSASTGAQSITEYALPPTTSPRAITTGPDGALWFTEFSDDVGSGIGRITPSGVITLPSMSELYGNSITAGPDGALWFTGYGNAIGRITTSGAISVYPTPTDTSSPNGIAAGPDGALWFTELTGNRIGRITTTGAITEFPLPMYSGGPLYIAAGSDGALWFTNVSSATGSEIGRITTSGVITEFSIPGSSPGLGATTAVGIAAGAGRRAVVHRDWQRRGCW